jgi:hypothetical protein
MKRKLVIFAASVTTIFLAIILTIQYAKGVITKGEKRNENAAWGYQLEKYWFQNRYRLTIWEISSESETYQIYEGTAYWGTPKVNDAQWLSGDRAIYLALTIDMDDSDPSEYAMRPAVIIYDYTRGQMTRCSALATPWGYSTDAGSTGENECQKILKQLGN